MASQTIIRLYDNPADAVEVVQQLEAAGVPHSDISLVSNDAEGLHNNVRPMGTATGLTLGDPDQGAATGAGTGASLGTALGGGAGLLAGIGALAIPGIGPIVAAGWLVAVLTGAGVGAAAGGLLGSLTGAGVSEADAHVHAEGVPPRRHAGHGARGRDTGRTRQPRAGRPHAGGPHQPPHRV